MKGVILRNEVTKNLKDPSPTLRMTFLYARAFLSYILKHLKVYTIIIAISADL